MADQIDLQKDETGWKGRSRGSNLGYRIFIALLHRGGLNAAYTLLRFVGMYYRLFARSATKPLRYLYEVRMGFSRKESTKLIIQNIQFFGQTIIDKIAVLTGAGARLSFDHTNGQYLNQLAEAGTGGIIVSAHLGNWEVAGHMLKRLGTTINILMHDGEAEQIKALMEQFDQKRSFNIIYLNENLSHIYEVAAALRRGELVCISADRFRPGNRTMVHEFLGEPAHFPAGPFLLASKLRAPVCFVFAFKESKYHYNFFAWEAKTYEGRGTAGAERMLHDFVGLLEEQIQIHPSQWFNFYDFWKAKP